MKQISDELYSRLDQLGLLPNETRNHHVGGSDYSERLIQPWAIWMEYRLDPWDADIVKRVLRTKAGEPRSRDYRKIIHVCQEKLRQLQTEEHADDTDTAAVQRAMDKASALAEELTKGLPEQQRPESFEQIRSYIVAGMLIVDNELKD